MTTEASPRPHPATFSRELIPLLVEAATPWATGLMLDPFAGIGKGSKVADALYCTFVGFEIEPEWACQHPDVIVADSTMMPLPDASVDVIITSPAYGNRMADRYAGSPADMEHFAATGRIRRRTYRIALGRPLHEANTGGHQWGQKYRQLHRKVWAECHRVLRPGGGLVLNVSDHYRKKDRVPVTAWHIETLEGLGFRLTAARAVETQRYREGQNHEARVPTESVLTFTKPEEDQ